MIPIGRNGTFLFDGDCGICSRLVELGREIDRDGTFIFEPYFRFSEEELAPHGLDHAACSRAARLILPDGTVRSGAFAVNGFLLRFFPLSVIVWLIYLLFPVMVPLEMLGYALVARNRHHISRWLGLSACAVRQGTDAPRG